MKLPFGLALIAALAQASEYAILGAPGPWPAILESAGHVAGDPASATLLIVRGPTDPAIQWTEAVAAGRIVVVEGDHPLLDRFGFRRQGTKADVRRVVDTRYTEQMIVWDTAESVPRLDPPAGAIVFAKERWSEVPLMVGARYERGAILWLATSPGIAGYERLPYIPQALAQLGASSSVAGRRLVAFYDHAYRSRSDPEYMARWWRGQGIAQLHVSAWYFQERDAARDDYLRRLIRACHRNGILVYCWFELPHVSEAFWDAYPACREKNALLQDAAIYWRKNMNLLGENCFRLAADAVSSLLRSFDWDGANLAELYFEGPRGFSDLSETTPLNDDVRAEVKRLHGFDPASLFDPSSPIHHSRGTKEVRLFLDYRTDLQYRLHVRFLELLDSLRKELGRLALAVTYLEDVVDPAMRDLVGADARRILNLMPRFDFSFILEDPSSVWGLGPSRYRRMADLYREITDDFSRLAVDINVVQRYSLAYPTPHQTGVEFAQLIHTVQRNFPTVVLYFENSILPPDASLVAAAHASVDSYSRSGGSLQIGSTYGAGLSWAGPALVDGKPWPHQDDSTVWLLPGKHTIAPRESKPWLRLTDFNGNLNFVEEFDRGISFSYKNSGRAIAVIDKKPTTIWIDGKESSPVILDRKDGAAILLPPGEHWVSLAAN